jgi:hypothetical protein
MICARLKPAVSGLEQKFPGKVTAQNVDASTPEAKKEVQDLGFISHGLVIRSTDGRTLFKQPDHKVQMDGVEAALHQILGT